MAGQICTRPICDDPADPVRAAWQDLEPIQLRSLATSSSPFVYNGRANPGRLSKKFGPVRTASIRAILPNIDTWVLSGAAPMSDVENPNSSLQKAFTSALMQTEALRKRDRSTSLDCTRFFDEFKRYKEIEPYIKFFNSIGITVILDDRNQRHYVAFELNHTLLQGMGFSGFWRGDRLVIVFTTANASSSEVTSFKVTLLNDNYL
jgi:hypothetical protein